MTTIELANFDAFHAALTEARGRTVRFWMVGDARSKKSATGGYTYEPIARIHLLADAGDGLRVYHVEEVIDSAASRARVEQIRRLLDDEGVLLVHGKPPAVVPVR